ncbi:Hypothetical predicted protein [Pelobates cultripes]|uniref:Uncharacterized protein n=1 Tax=Pelobates cultripes TaxID=61616 RepID=A0AAD1W267_PELCU|nr:Hypothetical predicted protein [Pelobates cultripes]
MGKKNRRRTGAYIEFQTTRLAPETAVQGTRYDTHLLTGTTEPDRHNMGRQSQRPPQATSRDTQDIGEWLQKPMAPKMGASPDHTLVPQDEGEQPGDEQELSTAQPTKGILANRNKLTPATKQDIADLLMEMRHGMRTEIQAVNARTQASEEDILDLKQEVKGLKEHFLHIPVHTHHKSRCGRGPQ